MFRLKLDYIRSLNQLQNKNDKYL